MYLAVEEWIGETLMLPFPTRQREGDVDRATSHVTGLTKPLTLSLRNVTACYCLLIRLIPPSPGLGALLALEPRNIYQRITTGDPILESDATER